MQKLHKCIPVTDYLQTRVLATNSVFLLPEVDRILVLVDGCLVESGTYEELKEKEGAFVDFLKNHLQDEEDKEEPKREIGNRILQIS